MNTLLQEDDPTRIYSEDGEMCTVVLQYFIRMTLDCEAMPTCHYAQCLKDMNAEQYELFSEICNAYEDGYQW